MKEKIRTLLLLLVTLISGSVSAETVKWICDGSSQTEGDWLEITHTKNSANWYNKMNLLIDGVSTSNSSALKMQIDTKITIKLEKKANVTIGVTTKNNNPINAANAKIKFDGTASESILEEDQEASNGVYTSKEITYTNVAAGEHTITRNSSELGVYYVKVDYDTNDQPYTVTFNQNGATSLTETAANAGIVLPGIKFTPVTGDWNHATQFTGKGNYRTSFVEGYVKIDAGIPAGDVITQTATGLSNGKYLISLSAAASVTNPRDNLHCPTGNELTEVFAGDQKQFIPVKERIAVGEGEENTVNFIVDVTDGTLTYGLRNVALSGNWYIIKVNSITKCDGTDGLLGWYDTNGNKVGDAGDTYYPEADITLKAKYTYTLNSYIKDTTTSLEESRTGEAFEGEKFGFHRYLTKDGKLYETTNNAPYYYGIELHEPVVYTKEYTLVNDKGGQTIDGTENARVVFLSEAEDITGFGLNQRTGVDVRCSNMYGGEVRNTPAVITSLPNGQYKIYAGLRGGTTKDPYTYEILVNDEVKASYNGTGDAKQEFWTSEPVVLNSKSTDVKAGIAYGSNVWDYFIIVKTGDAAAECPHTIYEGDVIGETDNSSAWWHAHSKQFEISKGNSRTFTFISNNFTRSGNTYERNWGLVITDTIGHNGDASWNTYKGQELFAVSGSGSNWGVGSPNLKFYRGNTLIDAGGDEVFFTDMESGSAETTINVSYVGKRIYLQGKIRTNNGKTYSIYSTSEEIDKKLREEKVYPFFAVANNHLTEFTVSEEQRAYQVVSIPGFEDENGNVKDATAAQGTISITDAEGIEMTPLTYVSNGTQLTFTATPGTGYIFSRWANGTTDPIRTVTYEGNEDIVMYSYFKIAAGALTVAKPVDLLLEMGASETLTANAQWAGGKMPEGATYTWKTTQDYETIYTMTDGENLTSPTYNYSQTDGWAGRWYYRVDVTYGGKTVSSDWAKLIVKGGAPLDASLPVTVKFSPEDRDTLGYLRTDASKNLSKSLEGVKNPPYLRNGEFISITEKGAKAFVINTRKGGGSGYGDFEVYVDDEKVGETIHLEQSTTMTTKVINIPNFDPTTTRTIKIVSKATGSDLTMHYIQFFSTDNAELKTTSAEVKMRQPQTIAIESFSHGAITMQPANSEFFDATFADGQLTITPKKPGEGVIKFDIAAATGFNANTVDFTVSVKKQNITMAFTPDNYTWNKVEQPEKPAFVTPQLIIKDEDGNIVSDYEFSGLNIWTLDGDIIKINNNAISVPEDAQGTGTATAEWGGDVNYNKPENAVYSVNIVQGVSFYTVKSKTYNVGEKGYLKENEGTADEKTLVTFTYGGWMLKDHKYPNDKGETLTDSWKKGEQEDKKLFPPVDPGFEYHTTGNQNAKSESYPNGGNFTTGDTFTLPVRGDYMTFEPTVNGTLSVYILQNGCFAAADGPNDAAKYNEFSARAVYVVDGEGNHVEDYTKFDIKTNQTINAKRYRDATADDTETVTHDKKNYVLVGEYYLVTDPSDPSYNNELNVATWTGFTALSSKEQADYAAAWNTGVGGTQKIVRRANGSYSAIQKGMMKYTFYVAAGQTYYIFANGSKIGFVGCNFVKDADNKQPTGELHLLENEAYNPNNLTVDHSSNINVPMYKTVTLNRSFTAGNWNTICLPFTMTEQEVEENFGKGTELIILDNVNIEGDKATIHFTYHEIQSIVAGFPYLIKPTQSCSSISVSNKIINPDTQLTTFASNGYTSKGIDGFCTANVSNGKVTNNYSHQLKAGDIFLSSNTLYISKGASYLKGYRAYIDAPVGAQLTSISFEYGHAWDEDEESTAIGLAEMDPEVISTFGGMMQGVYNLNGQKVANSTDNLPKGIYIVNGQKVTVE